MLKRVFVGICTFGLFICIAGCCPQALESNIAKISVRTDNLDEKEVKGVKIKEPKIKSEGNISQFNIIYPYLDDYSDDIINKINEEIFNMVVTEDLILYKDYVEEVDLSYEITYANDQILSILFSGYKNAYGSYADFDKALTFNLDNGELLAVSDFYTKSEINKLIVNAIKRNKLEIIGVPLSEEGKAEIVNDNFMSLLKKESFINRTDNYYIRDNKICFIFNGIDSFRQNILIEVDIGTIPDIKNN